MALTGCRPRGRARRPRARGAAPLVLALLAAGRAGATDYYVAAAGDDANSGLGPAQAWATAERASTFTFAAGDRLLFEGGVTFTNPAGRGIYLDAADGGTPAQPITIGSWGTGRATIVATTRLGFYGYNVGGVEIRDIDFRGPGGTAQRKDGIAFYVDLPGVLLSHVRIADVDVEGFGSNGISIGGFAGDAGYRDVRIERVAIRACGENGIVTFAENDAANRDVTVLRARVEDVPGIPGAAPSGSGIVLGQVADGLVERSVVRRTGAASNAANGPNAIWAHASTRVALQHNEAYDNRTARAEGGGIGLDDNTSQSLVQHNWTHGNDGPGTFLTHTWDNQAATGNVVRFNVSQDDGRLGTGSFRVRGRVLDAEVYHNTWWAPAGTPGAPLVAIANAGIETLDVAGLHLRNNVLAGAAGATLAAVAATQLDGAVDLRFEGNLYHAGGGPIAIGWGAATHGSLAAWRAATGQEMLGATATGLEADPGLANPGGGPALGDADLLETLPAYRLLPGSAAADAGLDLLAAFGIDAGPRDFWGVARPQGAAPDAGAAEREPRALLRADLSALEPRSPPLSQVYPFDPANPLTPVAVPDFRSGDADPAPGAAPLALYQVHPGGTQVLLAVRSTSPATALFTLR